VDNYGHNNSHAYPDTIIFFDKPLRYIKAQSYVVDDYCEKTIEQILRDIPSDTLSIFYFHSDTLNKYSWEEIQRDYRILQRYDLSIEDIHVLYDQYDIPEIPYPPTEIMKNMKMYPSYEK
jgi:hypothetical protein